MRVLVFGAGAMGSFVGGLLAKEHEVTFIGRKPHMTAIREHGLEIDGKTKLKLPKSAIRTFENIEPLKSGCDLPELLLVTVKSYDTKNIVPDLQQIISDNTILLSFQNGLDSAERLRNAFPKNVVIGSTICHGVTYLKPGKVYHAGFGDTMVGAFLDNQKRHAITISKIFNEIGLENQMTNNICGEIWTKVGINASINPITAITGLKNGWLLREERLKTLLENTCNEVIQVAKKSGAKIPRGPRGKILERTLKVLERTSDNKSSMLQDIEKGRRTEIDSINGAVVRIGAHEKVPTPLNSTLTVLVKGLEQQILKD